MAARLCHLPLSQEVADYHSVLNNGIHLCTVMQDPSAIRHTPPWAVFTVKWSSLSHQQGDRACPISVCILNLEVMVCTIDSTILICMDFFLRVFWVILGAERGENDKICVKKTLPLNSYLT